MTFSLTRHGENCEVAVQGQLVASNRQELRQAVLAELDAGARRFMIDFERTGYIDSAGLGILVAADHLLLMRAGGCPVLDRRARLCLLLLGLGSGLGLEGGGTARLLRLGSRDPEAAQKCDGGSGAEPLAANHHQSP